jgi:hypothetical protein
MRPTLSVIAVLALVSAGAAVGSAVTATADHHAPVAQQQSWLLARSVLSASTVRAGSPPAGAFFSDSDKATAAANGVPPDPAAAPAYFAHQPVQGVSSAVPAGDGTWWTLADNGFGSRGNSGDWQLVLYRMDLGFGDTAGPTVLESVVLSDPGRFVPWKTMCDRTGADLPPFTFNAFTTPPPPACGPDPAARLLTGFDFDPESVQVARDGTFWLGDEFGPFLLHADRQGRLLQAPIGVPGAKSPQNPTLDVLHGEEPTVAQSRGLESLAIDPSRSTLFPMTEGAVGADDPQTLRVLSFDLRHQRFTRQVRTLRLEMPGAKVDLTSLRLVDSTPDPNDNPRAYPTAVAPTGTGGESAAELTAVNGHQFLLVERDSFGDGVAAPRFKKVFLVGSRGHRHGGALVKSLLVDLMAVPDPTKVGGDGDFFRFPFNTIESVHVVDARTVLVANDNNYPFSNARSRSLTNDRTGPLAPDANEFIEVRLGTSLRVDRRLLDPNLRHDDG